MANYGYNYDLSKTLPLGGGVGNLSFGQQASTPVGAGSNYSVGPMSNYQQYTPLAVSTAGTSLAPTISSFSDNLSQILSDNGVSGVIDPTAVSTTMANNQFQAPAAAGEGWLKNTFMKDGALNIGSITDLLGSIGGIYGAIKQYGLMKDSLDFQKESFRTNLNNQTKSYNTALEDRASARASFTGQDQKETDEYIRKNRL